MFFGLVRGEGGRVTRHSGIRTVLVVEDEPLVAFDNEHALVQGGYRIAATVEDHGHAIHAIDAGGIDLVIADVGLRGALTGIDVAVYAREKGLPVLFVTASCPVDARTLAMGCLAKPYHPRDLIAAIRVVDAILRGVRCPKSPPGLSLFTD